VNKLRGMVYAKFRTETACAAALGWPKQKLNYITNGQRAPSIRDAWELSTVLEVDLGELCDIFLNSSSTKR